MYINLAAVIPAGITRASGARVERRVRMNGLRLWLQQCVGMCVWVCEQMIVTHVVGRGC